MTTNELYETITATNIDSVGNSTFSIAIEIASEKQEFVLWRLMKELDTINGYLIEHSFENNKLIALIKIINKERHIKHFAVFDGRNNIGASEIFIPLFVEHRNGCLNLVALVNDYEDTMVQYMVVSLRDGIMLDEVALTKDNYIGSVRINEYYTTHFFYWKVK